MHQLFLSDDPIAGGGNLRVKLPLVAPSSQFGGLLGGLKEPRIQELWFRNGSQESQTWYRPIILFLTHLQSTELHPQ
jgi:hypothetical protein